MDSIIAVLALFKHESLKIFSTTVCLFLFLFIHLWVSPMNMMFMFLFNRKAFGILCAMTLFFRANAQEPDVEGAKDHPMLSRIPGFYIYEYYSNFNSHVFPEKGTDENVGKTLEGNLTRIVYAFDSESGKKCPSTLQVMRNYANAITKLGGVKVAECTIPGYSMWYVGKIQKDAKTIWVHVGDVGNDNNGNGGPGMLYTLFIMEIAAMEQEVTSTDILDALKSQGFIALDIQFDTGKSSLNRSRSSTRWPRL